jgi:hypothetical protein
MFFIIFLAVFLAIGWWKLMDLEIGKYNTPIGCWIAVAFLLPFLVVGRLFTPKSKRTPLSDLWK